MLCLKVLRSGKATGCDNVPEKPTDGPCTRSETTMTRQKDEEGFEAVVICADVFTVSPSSRVNR